MKNNRILQIVFILLILILAVPYFLKGRVQEYLFKGLTTGVIKLDLYSIEDVNTNMAKTSLIYELEKGILIPGHENLFKKFHLGDSLIPLPVKHPLYVIAPIITTDEDDVKKAKLGVTFASQSKEVFMEFFPLKNKLFKFYLTEQEVFRIPFFKSHILKRDKQEIWADLFALDVYKDINKISVRDFIYRLFIWNLRQSLLDKDGLELSFYPNNNVGIVKSARLKRAYNRDKVYLLRNNIIYSFEMRTAASSPEAVAIRSEYIKQLGLRTGGKELGKIIYKEFQDLSLKQKTTELGMFYLLSAWSQDIQNKYFLADIIQYLERGRGHVFQLAPLYDYAYKLYGTNFSLIQQRKKQIAEERLKAGIAKEDDAIMEEKEVEELPVTSEQKIDYMLRKAREKKSKRTDRLRID